jgi:tRNA1Val (adenine37-N6)-methyltransferase
MDDLIDLRDDETVDELLEGRLRIAQKKRGYRFSIDALLLAHFAVVREGDDLIDLGTGSGVIALILAERCHCGRVLGVDIQDELVDIATRNVVLNNFSDRIEVLQGDVRHPEAFCEPHSFSVAVFNPPYRRLLSGRMNPHPEKAVARHEIVGNIGHFIAAAVYALRPMGRIYAIYPAGRLVQLIAKMREHRVEPKRLRMVHSRCNGPGEFVLLEGVKGGREGLKVLPSLFIYGEQGGYSQEMLELFRSL